MRSTGPNGRGFDLLRLHLRLKDTVSRILEFVNCTQIYLSSQSSQQDLRRHQQLLDVLKSDKEQWEHYVSQAVGVDAWLIREQGVAVEREFEGDLGKVTEILAGAQGKLMAGVKRYSAEMTPLVWEIFADMRQAFWEQFFKAARASRPDPKLQESIRMQEEKLSSMQERLQVMERRYSSALEQIEVKEQMIQRMKGGERAGTPRAVEMKDREIQRLSRLIDAQEKVIFRKLSVDSSASRKDSDLDSLHSYRTTSRQLPTPSSPSKDLPGLQAELEDVLAERDQLRELIQSRSPSKRIDSMESEHMEDKRRVNSAISGVRRAMEGTQEALRPLDTYEKQKQRPLEEQLKLEKERSKAFFRALKAKEREFEASQSPTKLQDLHTKIGNLQQCLQEKEAAISQLQADLDATVGRLRENRPQQRSSLEARVKEAEERAVRLSREVESMRVKLETSENSSSRTHSLKRKAVEMEEERDQVLSQLRELRAEYETCRLELEKTTKSNQQIIKELAKNTEFQSKIALEQQFVQNKAGNMVENVKKELLNRYQRLNDTVNQAEKRLESLENLQKSLQNTHKSSGPAKELGLKAIEENRDLNRKLDSIMSEFEAKNEAEKRLKEEITRLKEQNESDLSQLKSDFNRQIEALAKEKRDFEQKNRKEIDEIGKRYESERELAQVEITELERQLKAAVSRGLALDVQVQSLEIAGKRSYLQVEALQFEVESKTSLISDLQNQLKTLEFTLETTDFQVKTLSSDLALRINRETELQEELSALQAVVEQPSKTPADCDILISTEIERLTQEISELEEKIQALERENELKDQTIVTVNREIEENNQETSRKVTNLKEEIVEIRNEKEKIASFLHISELELASKRENEQNLASERLKLLTELEELRGKADLQAKEADRMQKALEEEKNNSKNVVLGLKEQVRKLKIEITNSELRLEAKEHALEKVQNELEALRTAHNSSEILSNELLRLTETLNTERLLHEQQLTDFKSQLFTLTQERNQAKDDTRSIRSDFEAMKTTVNREKEDLGREKEAVQGRLDEVLKALEELKDTHEATVQKVNSLKQELKGKTSDLMGITAKLRGEETKNEDLHAIIETHKEKIGHLTEENGRILQDLRDLTGAESAAKALNTISSWREELQGMQTEQRNTEEMLTAATQTLADSERQWRANLEIVAGQMQAVQREKERLEADLQATKREYDLEIATKEAQSHTKIAEMEKKLTSREAQLLALEKSFSDQKEQFSEEKERFLALEIELNTVKNELKSARNLMNSVTQTLVEQIEAAKAQAEALQRKLTDKDAQFADFKRISDAKERDLTAEVEKIADLLANLREESRNNEEDLQLEAENLREELKREVERRQTELDEANEEKKRREAALAAGFEERIGLLRAEITQAGEQFARLSKELAAKETTINEQNHSYETDNRELRSAIRRLEEAKAVQETNNKAAAEAKEGEIAVLTGQLEAFKGELGRSKDTAAANEGRLTTALEEARKAVAALEKQVKEGELREQEASKQLKSLQDTAEKQKSDIQSQKTQFDIQKQALEDEKLTLLQRFSEKDAEMNALIRLLSQEKAENAAKGNQIRDLEATLNQSYANKDSELRERLDQLRDANTQIATLREELRENKGKIDELREDIETARQRELELKGKLETAEKEIKRVNLSMDEAKALHFTEMNAKTAEIDQIRTAFDRENREKSAEIASLQGNYQELAAATSARIAALEESLEASNSLLTAKTQEAWEERGQTAVLEERLKQAQSSGEVALRQAHEEIKALKGEIESGNEARVAAGREAAQALETLQSQMSEAEKTYTDQLRDQAVLMSSLQKDLTAQQLLSQSLQQANAQAEVHLTTQEKAIREAKAELELNIQAVNQLKSEKSALETYLNDAKRDLESVKSSEKAALATLKAQEEASKSEIDQLTRKFALEKADFSQNLLSLNSEISHLRKENSRLSSLQEEISVLYSNRLEEVNKLTGELVAAQKQQEINAALSRENENLKEDLTGKERERSSLTQENEKLKEELRTVRESYRGEQGEITLEEGEEEIITVVKREIEVSAQPFEDPIPDSDFPSEIANLTVQLASSEAQILQLTSANSLLQTQLSAAALNTDKLLKETARLNSIQEEISILYGNRLEEVNRLTSELVAAKKQQELNVVLSKENEGLKSDLTGKELERSSLTQENEKLKEELMTMRVMWRDSRVVLPVEQGFEDSEEESFTVVKEERETARKDTENSQKDADFPVIQRVKSREIDANPFNPAAEISNFDSSIQLLLSNFDKSVKSGYSCIERRCEQLQMRIGRLVCLWESSQPCLSVRKMEKEDEASSPGAPTPDKELVEGVCMLVEYQDKRWELVQSGFEYQWKEAFGPYSPGLRGEMAVLSDKTATVIESLEKRVLELTNELEQRGNSKDYADAKALLVEKGFNFQGQTLTNVVSSLLVSSKRSKRPPPPLELPSDPQYSPNRPSLTSPNADSSKRSSDSLALSEQEATSLFQTIERMKRDYDDLMRVNEELERQVALHKQRTRSTQDSSGIAVDELTMVVQNLLEALPMQ